MAATIQPGAAAGSVVVMEKTDKRDYLIDLEKSAQQSWAESKAFEVDPPALPSGVSSYTEFFKDGHSIDDVKKEHPKWFGTFPYAYMNGSLHLGHAFTISKIEFAAGFERMRGKKVLFPVGYHATGMPIKAAADKLVREMEMFGEDFSGYDAQVDEKPAETTAAPKSADPSKASKGKVNLKSTGLSYQFQILELIGVPRDEIKLFADPLHWLQYFPPIAKNDLSGLGARVDWRRQFITTPANPYYDSFVRWQMNKLHDQGKIKFGERYTIYSPKDGQPCMDHDRQSGEAVNPVEMTALKIKVTEWGPYVPDELKQAVGGKKVFAVAATLRPETMYGQTNCFVGPKLKYGVYEASDDELYIITDRAARNMAFQGCFQKERGVFNKIADVVGADLVGTKVEPPNGFIKEVYILPMEGVLATKGTGVVTSVPSDSPDDYQTLLDLRKKPEMYKIKPEWAAFEPIAVLSTPKFGEMSAITLVKDLKIQSQRDTVQLALAKDMAYKEGFTNGVMLVGPYKGERVETAKPKVREQMVKDGLAFYYAEPENEVISRSADVCVVALVDQWYLDYGETEWKATATRLLSQMNTYLPETRNAFDKVLDWLKQWACARSFGLGSKLPWDPQFLVESLSDSTIYMSYYTVANLLHDDKFGDKPGPLGVTADQMTDAMWDYVLGDGAFPSDSTVPEEKAAQLKYSFQYFYPLDIRSSGKDLINNHLTFWIYVHAALFPEKHWPRAVRANGHLMLNGNKMSKSTGNFLTMQEATKKYGADAMRLSLADAGDEITDANFEETVANAAILRLHTAVLWAEEIKANEASLRTGELNDFDLGFQADMDNLCEQAYEAYDQMEFKEALKKGLYDFEIARNWYRGVCSPENGGPGMHRDLILEYIRRSALLIAPFTPHFSEHIYKTVLGEEGSIQSASFPRASGKLDQGVIAQLDYMRGVVDSIRGAEAQNAKKKGKGKASGAFDASKPKRAVIYVATEFPAWQDDAIAVLKSAYDPEKKTVDDAKLKKAVVDSGLVKNKKAMPFVQTFKLLQQGESAFTRNLPFSEYDALKLLEPFIKASLKFVQLDIVRAGDALKQIEAEGEGELSKEKAESAEPGLPGVQFVNIEA